MSSEEAALSRPPLNILTNPQTVRRKHPWEIDLASLLDMLLSLLKGRGEGMDLRLCGTAALSSAFLYRLKVESLFLFERVKAERRDYSFEELPQIIQIPFRFDLPSSSIDDLISALEKVLLEALSERGKGGVKPRILEPTPSFDTEFLEKDYLAEALAPFRANILEILAHGGEISFLGYISEKPLIERVRDFILLLFLANEQSVSVKEVEDDIRIFRTGTNSA